MVRLTAATPFPIGDAVSVRQPCLIDRCRVLLVGFRRVSSGGQSQPFCLFTPFVAVLFQAGVGELQEGNRFPQRGHQGIGCGAGFRLVILNGF